MLARRFLGSSKVVKLATSIDFETDLGNWAVSDPANMVLSAVDKHAGTKSLQISMTGTAITKLLGTVESASGGNCTFYFKSASGTVAYGALSVYVDSVLKISPSLSFGWQQYYFTLPAGRHNVEFRFTHSDSGTHSIYMDDIVVPA